MGEAPTAASAAGDAASEVDSTAGAFFVDRRRSTCRRSRPGHTWRTAPQPEAEEAVAWAFEQKAQLVDLKFCDLLGSWQHMTLPIGAFGTSAFSEGLGFDGSSIRGWQGIAESDLLLMPDPAARSSTPSPPTPTLSLVCEIADPTTGEPYGRDPRRIARRAEAYLRETGHRRHGLLRAGVRVLRLRRRLLRALAAPRALRGRLGRGPLELLRAGARLHRAREGRLLPAGAARHAARPALGDRPHPRAPRDPVRVPPPRGRHGRPVRGRPPLPVRSRAWPTRS